MVGILVQQDGKHAQNSMATRHIMSQYKKKMLELWNVHIIKQNNFMFRIMHIRRQNNLLFWSMHIMKNNSKFGTCISKDQKDRLWNMHIRCYCYLMTRSMGLEANPT